MKVVDPGHSYELDLLDGPGVETLTFVKREGVGYPGNVGHHAGTNLQEVLRVLINRVEYLNGQIRCSENPRIVGHLVAALFLLESRAASRHGRELDPNGWWANIAEMPTCKTCGHILCEGHK